MQSPLDSCFSYTSTTIRRVYALPVRRSSSGTSACQWRDAVAVVARWSITHAHAATAMLRCGACSFTCPSGHWSTLLYHKRSKHGGGIREFACDYPGCAFACHGKSALHIHSFVHATARPFPCDVSGCTYAAKKRGDLRLHLARVHERLPAGPRDMACGGARTTTPAQWTRSGRTKTRPMHASAPRDSPPHAQGGRE